MGKSLLPAPELTSSVLMSESVARAIAAAIENLSAKRPPSASKPTSRNL
jgi:hypothetical protein